MSERLDYIKSLLSQRPEVERIRSEARARGDVATVRNAELLLAQWAPLIASLSPVNDRAIGLLHSPPRH